MAGWLCAAQSAAAAECVPLAVQPVLGNTMVLGFMCHIGFGIAACSHVGNLLGAGEPRRARVTAYTGESEESHSCSRRREAGLRPPAASSG
eukprot:SAG11_NODE_477_length_9118_cov_3.513582_7_plen_91_part_00